MACRAVATLKEQQEALAIPSLQPCSQISNFACCAKFCARNVLRLKRDIVDLVNECNISANSCSLKYKSNIIGCQELTMQLLLQSTDPDY